MSGFINKILVYESFNYIRQAFRYNSICLFIHIIPLNLVLRLRLFKKLNESIIYVAINSLQGTVSLI
jgi:hypothetical protein